MPVTIEQVGHAWDGLTAEDHAYGQIVATGMAAILESRGYGHDAGPIWQTIGVSQEVQLRLDPQETFTRAIELVMLNDGGDPDSQQFVQWLQGNGLQQLTDPRLTPYLEPYLATSDSTPFVNRLLSFVNHPIPYDQISTKHDLGYFPQCYLTFISVLLASRLSGAGNTELITRLREASSELLTTPDFQRIVGLYATITDTRQFAEQLSISTFNA